MEKKKLSKKKIIWISVISGVLAALIILVVFAIIMPKSRASVKLTDVQKGEIVQSLEKIGTVESADSTCYPIIDGVKVLTVNVALGDTVKVGDKLATFDVSSLSGLVAEKTADYENSKTLYENSVATVAEAKTKIPQLEQEISKIEAEIAAIEKKAESNKETTTKEDPSNDTLLGAIGSILDGSVSAIRNIFNPIKSNGTGLDEITNILNNSTSLLGNTELSKKQIELAEAKSKLILMNLQVQLNIGKSYYKSLMDSKYSDLQSTKATIEQLKKGWTATSNGVITEINIKPGETYFSSNGSSNATANLDVTQILSSISGGADITSLLQNLTSAGQNNNYGLVLDNYDGFIVRFTIGETEANSVKVGQNVAVKSKTGTFTGKINYISAKAVTGTGIDFSSLSSALTGNSTTSNLEVTATIENPDQSIIIGFNVDVDIELDKKEDVILVPFDVVQHEKIEEERIKYVFIYENGKVYKRQIETGISSDEHYQVLIGLNEGDKVVKSVSGESIKNLEDGAKVTVEK